MSSIVKYKNQSGITYAYEQTAVWDPEKKQARPKRKYLGRVDEATGEIITTNRKRKVQKTMEQQKEEVQGNSPDYKNLYDESRRDFEEVMKTLRLLEDENKVLKQRIKKLEENAHEMIRRTEAVLHDI